jgi:hypothetical protein
MKISEESVKNYSIIDTHVHLGKYAGSFINSDYGPELLKTFKSFGYKKIIFTHNSFFFDLEKGLKNTLEIISKNRDFAYGYLVYNPAYIGQSLNIIKSNFGKNNIVGIKMHPEEHQCHITDERYGPLWKIADEKKIPVLSHTWNPNVASKSQKYADALLFEKILKDYPSLKIILGHAGAKDYYYFEVIKMLERCKGSHLYIDIAGDIFYRSMIENFAEKAGAHKILFGSDAPWVDPAFTISYVESSNLNQSEKASVFFGNAAKLFGI